MSTDEEVRRVGRPRDETLTRRILDAAREELTAAGVDGFSIRQVARRAQVTRKAVAVRWSSAEELLLDAMGAIDELTFEPTGDLERDLTELGRKFIAGLESGALDLQLRVTADAPQHPEVYASLQQHVLLPMSRALVATFKAAQVSGQVREGDISWLVRGFVGALLAQTFQLPGRAAPSEEDLRELVAEIKRWSRP
ncbi:TetR/AcrR family transcriptional regulator [Mycolicibacterium phlei]|uniref:TetR/AcrR family transcriptional regulator n=1 Tax=Mycolicibacterium phlei TaxID=1771 RepID=UPI00025ADED9|nr:TetR/AcrR family transcriptional regulator [Mycolicibacterium phlei]EID11755.1 TetR family transcriptional regulator [Mycolicibacterium phlei RIVM601174]MBF4193894.1 TetR family transcriptional regulator [Mycolicibacterium phlei]